MGSQFGARCRFLFPWVIAVATVATGAGDIFDVKFPNPVSVLHFCVIYCQSESGQAGLDINAGLASSSLYRHSRLIVDAGRDRKHRGHPRQRIDGRLPSDASSSGEE